MSQKLIRWKASEVASELKNELQASKRWIQRFLPRHKGKRMKLGDEAESYEMLLIKEWLVENHELLLMYKPENIWSCDETGLQWRKLNDQTYMIQDVEKLYLDDGDKENQMKSNYYGHKVDKQRITIMCCASMTGEKKKLLIIGRAGKPQCFKKIVTIIPSYRLIIDRIKMHG